MPNPAQTYELAPKTEKRYLQTPKTKKGVTLDSIAASKHDHKGSS
jgi:hypothetical protein